MREKKAARFEVRLTPAEKSRLASEAAKRQTTKSALVRKALERVYRDGEQNQNEG